jgi:hypothetical protein
MPRIDPLPRDSVGDLEPILSASENRMGFLPNSRNITATRSRTNHNFALVFAPVAGTPVSLSRRRRADAPAGAAMR